MARHSLQPGATPETAAQAVWRTLGDASTHVSTLVGLATALERYAGSAMAAPLHTALARVDDALTETHFKYSVALADAAAEYSQLEADKATHVEHLVRTRSARTVALAGVAEHLRTAVDHVAERARKSGRDLPEWHARATSALAQARELLDS